MRRLGTKLTDSLAVGGLSIGIILMLLIWLVAFIASLAVPTLVVVIILILTGVLPNPF